MGSRLDPEPDQAGNKLSPLPMSYTITAKSLVSSSYRLRGARRRNLTSSLYRLGCIGCRLKCKSTPENLTLAPSLLRPSRALSPLRQSCLVLPLACAVVYQLASLARATTICQLFRRYRNNLTKFPVPSFRPLPARLIVSLIRGSPGATDFLHRAARWARGWDGRNDGDENKDKNKWELEGAGLRSGLSRREEEDEEKEGGG